LVSSLTLNGFFTSLKSLIYNSAQYNHKYNKIEAIDPITGEIAPLYHPRQQKWYEHFSWNEDFSLLIGITTIGRVTVETLQLNREGLVNLRRVLCMANEHPP
jgi:hypothetical protein